ncbi:MAG TPA: hypothetical protein VF668_03100 [Pyrinomonadaceae bacterium]
MSPRKGILVSGTRPASASSARRAAACSALLLALSFACGAASASARAPRDGDLRRAEKVLAKLRLLHEAAAAGDREAYRALASKLCPDLFVKVAELSPGDLSTDLSTAVFLAERLARAWDASAATAADCRGERPDIYAPLCAALPGGAAGQLLLAKSRLHARWAEAVLRNEGGAGGVETARALAEMESARANDLLLAARVVETLTPLEELLGRPASGRADRAAAVAGGPDRADAEFADALRLSAALLAWMPRSQTFYRLSGAHQAYADGLSWRRKARQSKSLVVSARSFAPDPLKAVDLNAEQANAAARANLQSALKFTRLAQQSLAGTAR